MAIVKEENTSGTCSLGGKEPVSQMKEVHDHTVVRKKESRAECTTQQETAIGVNRNTCGRQGGHFTKKGRKACLKLET